MKIKKIIYLIIIYIQINLVKSYFIPEIKNPIKNSLYEYEDTHTDSNDKD